ncbi:phosphotriesterase family protein [Ornithinimicrobium pratense]|uniref:Aryldialkylphosphatase n=1 Tax=Ornithinimicrobium pratense TaxID=2593973 RepID=A0A5J6V7D3_9MICO|nr:aryldialkylphosphatase [Ornithinimicrobium pratense]QFG69735.1 aryldialkylphosphatase [Ornithinimicrobium pratense]
MTDRAVRTVLGDVAPGELGVVNYHEHLFQTTPLLPGDELDDEEHSRAEAADLVAAGVGCLVEATPIGLGRVPSAVRRISRDLGVHVVHTTGVHRESHYPARPDLTAKSTAQLAQAFRAELVDGLVDDRDAHDAEPARHGRAGLVKVGIGYWSVSAFERRAIEAAGGVSAELGAPVMVHLEHGSAAHEVLTMLAEAGCPEDRVALAHIDRNPDPGLHLELAARGAYLGYDGCARHKSWPDSVLVDCLEKVVAGGGEDRTLLGGDVARRSRYESYGGMPGLAYTYRRFLPRVRAAIGEQGVALLTTKNPSRWLTWRTAPEIDQKR